MVMMVLDTNFFRSKKSRSEIFANTKEYKKIKASQMKHTYAKIYI